MPVDIKDPGPNGDYPHFPRDQNGDPVRHLDGVEQAAGKDAMGNTIYVDLTPRTPDGRPISSVAPRLTRGPATGGLTRARWLTNGERTEEWTATTPNGQPLRLCRNLDTGEQVEW